MIPTELDLPDTRLGDEDPFVSALRVWSSVENLRQQGVAPNHVERITISMDAVLIRHRRELVNRYLHAPHSHRTKDLYRQLGLEYWPDGNELSANDPDRSVS